MTVRQPLGVAGLIIAANTPIANVAWKVFPALLCGNTAVLKAVGGHAAQRLGVRAAGARGAGFPPGVLNVVHGFGEEAGAPLVDIARVDIVSFTGSTAVGRDIGRPPGAGWPRSASSWAARTRSWSATTPTSTPAVDAAVLSAFSNAGPALRRGQPDHRVRRRVRPVPRAAAGADRRRSGSGCGDDDDFGPVINEAQLDDMLRRGRQAARRAGVPVLAGGAPPRPARATTAATSWRRPCSRMRRRRRGDLPHGAVRADLDASTGCRDFEAALALANDSPFGLTASIHTAQPAPRDGVSRPRSLRRGGRERRRPTAASRTCRSAVWATPATAGARPAPRRSTSTRTGRRCTSTTTRGGSEAVTHAPSRRRADPGPRGLEAGGGQERPPAGRPSAARVHASRRPSRAASSTRSIVSTDSTEHRRDRPRTTAPRCRSCARRSWPATGRPTSSWVATRLGDARRERARATTASASCGRPARSAGPRRSAAPGSASWRPDGRAIRCGRWNAAGSTRARCGCCRATGCARCSTAAR